jgi:cytochrome c oxidase assembly factor CtaG
VNALSLALQWRLDGETVGVLIDAFALAGVYLCAISYGQAHDRRGRRWPAHRTALFLSGVALFAIDLGSGIGVQADTKLSTHMLEHMVLWVGVAPLLVAGAPVRLALFALPRGGRRRLGRALRSRVVSALTGPVGSVAQFSAVIIVTHIPSVYGLALRYQNVHEAEHALYLVSAMLLWAPVLGVDPLPHRPTAMIRTACLAGCMVPMIAVAAWLAVAGNPVYGHYLHTLGASALSDQRLAATIMWAGGVPAFAIAELGRLRLPQTTSPRTPAALARESDVAHELLTRLDRGDSSAGRRDRPRPAEMVTLG